MGMQDGDNKLREWESHKTAAQVASYMRGQGSDVGREYKTHREVWDVDNSLLQVGLLHLILDRLEDLRHDPMKDHSFWLQYCREDVVKAAIDHEKQRRRLIKMFGEDVNLGDDLENYFDVHDSSLWYRRDSDVHYSKLNLLWKKIERMKSVINPDDVVNLAGIGKARAQKILAKLNATKEG